MRIASLALSLVLHGALGFALLATPPPPMIDLSAPIQLSLYKSEKGGNDVSSPVSAPEQEEGVASPPTSVPDAAVTPDETPQKLVPSGTSISDPMPDEGPTAPEREPLPEEQPVTVPVSPAVPEPAPESEPKPEDPQPSKPATETPPPIETPATETATDAEARPDKKPVQENGLQVKHDDKTVEHQSSNQEHPMESKTEKSPGEADAPTPEDPPQPAGYAPTKPVAEEAPALPAVPEPAPESEPKPEDPQPSKQATETPPPIETPATETATDAEARPDENPVQENGLQVKHDEKPDKPQRQEDEPISEIKPEETAVTPQAPVQEEHPLPEHKPTEPVVEEPPAPPADPEPVPADSPNTEEVRQLPPPANAGPEPPQACTDSDILQQALATAETDNIEELLAQALKDARRDSALHRGGGVGKGEGGGLNDLYAIRIIEAVRPHWNIPVLLPKTLIAEIRIKIDKDGRILSQKLIRSSGHADYDASALNALTRTRRLPMPPTRAQRDINIRFNSLDLQR